MFLEWQAAMLTTRATLCTEDARILADRARAVVEAASRGSNRSIMALCASAPLPSSPSAPFALSACFLSLSRARSLSPSPSLSLPLTLSLYLSRYLFLLLSRSRSASLLRSNMAL